MASNDFRSQKSKDFWSYLEENYKEVTGWPGWMKGESPKQSDTSSQKQCSAAEKDEQKRE